MSSSAMDASLRQSKPRPTGLLDLPNELLAEIASLVDDGLIQALRQTQESLDDIQRLLERPHVASGIRGIRVNLGYRFGSLTQDKSLFAQVLEDTMLSIYHFPSNLRLPSESQSEWSCRALQLKRDYFMCDYDMWEAWPHMLTHKAETDAEVRERYDRLLLSAYETYRQEYHEATRIASERSLILALVKLVSLRRRPVALKFANIYDWYGHLEYPGPETMFLKRMMEIPCLSSIPERYRKPVEDDMALLDGIIWDLPIDLHQPGCIVHAFVLEDVLNIMGDAVLFADALSSSSEKLNQLGQALQSLTKFGITWMMHMKEDLTEDPARCLVFGDLLRTCLSGPGLQSIRLKGLNGDILSEWATWARPSMPEEWRNRLTPVVTSIDVAHLKDFSVTCVPIILSDGKLLGYDETHSWSEGHLLEADYWGNARYGEWF